MERALVNPNFHVILIHYPLGLLITGVLVELFSFLWPRHALRSAGQWMILLGAAAAIPAALSGIYALWDVANPLHAEQFWKETTVSAPLNDVQWHQLMYHLRMMAIATLASMLAVVVWLGSTDEWRLRLRWPLMVLLLGACGVMVAGSWFAGESVYTQGTAVKLPPTSMPDLPPIQQKIEYYAQPLQAHAVGAGITMSFALICVGLSFRKLGKRVIEPQMGYIAAALEPEFQPGEALPTTQYSPTSRFWMITALLGFLTAGGGYYLIAEGYSQWDPRQLWPYINGSQRLLAHLIAGGSLIVLPILMAIFARWAPRQKLVLAFFTLLLIGAVGAQVWFGSLLLLDTQQGSINQFNEAGK